MSGAGWPCWFGGAKSPIMCRGLTAGVLMAGLLVMGHPASAQVAVVIPPPDDLVETIPPLPPATPPSLGQPGPPPSPALPSMTSTEARAEAQNLGGPLRDSYKDLTQASGAAGQVPGYQASVPGEASYYDNPDALAGAGASAAQGSDAWKTVNSNARPTVNVQRSDLARANAIEADPDAYLQGQNLDGTGSDCVPLPPGSGSPTMAEWTCDVGSGVVDVPQSCTRDLTVAEWNALSYQYLCVTSGYYDGCAALGGNSQCHQTASTPVPGYGITVDTYDCDAPVTDPAIYFIGTTAKPPPPGAFQVTNTVYRCNSEGLTDTLTVDPLTMMPNGYVTGLQQCGTLQSDPTCTATTASAAGLGTRTLCRTWTFVGDPFFGGSLVCTELAAPESVFSCTSNVAGVTPESVISKWFVETWTNAACSIDPASCTTGAVTCTAPDQTRMVGGVAVTRPCWQYSTNYLCQSVVGGKNDCGALESNPSCTLDHEQCLDEPPAADGSCAVKERVYKCPIPGTTPPPVQYICGNDVYCIDGTCETIVREPSDEFKDAVVALNTLGQANAEFDQNTLTLFKGDKLQCSHKLFGLSNCCTGSGIPLLTPWLCNAEEQLLDQRVQKGLCHKLGTYCSSKFLGICITRKDAWCCFQSKLSRILQEQGRPQIGKPWGPPKTGTCDGFTIFEFQQLDLSVMDFSEVYAEFEAAARLPDEAAALADIQQKIRDYYARGGPSPP